MTQINSDRRGSELMRRKVRPGRFGVLQLQFNPTESE